MRRRRRNPAASQIAWAVGLAAATTAAAVLVTWYLERKLPKEEEKKPALNVAITGEWPEKLKELFQPVSRSS